MHQQQFQQWIKQNKVKELINKNTHHFKRILSDCLNYNQEQILIVSDYGQNQNIIAPILAGCFLKAAPKAKLVMQNIKSKSQEAEKQVIQALDELPEKNIIILCLTNMLGKMGKLGKSYRRFCRSRKHKFTSTTGMGNLNLSQLNKVIKALDIDYVNLRAQGLKLKQELDKAKEIKIKTKAGTNLTLDVENMNASTSTGIYNEPGLGGNIPTGEVYIPPRIRTTEGTLVVDVSVRHKDGTLKITKEPLIITIKQGKVTKLEGTGAELVEQTLQEAENKAKYPERIRLIAELGIGINPGAEIVGSTIIDEKVKKTAHIAMGSNYWFGGQIKTIIHLDQVFKNPEIYLDGKKLKI